MNFAPFQRRFLAAVDSPRYRTVAASWPRGCGKTTLAGHVVARALTPGDPLYVAGGEVVLFAGSIEQCRLTYRQALGFLESRIGEYRTVDSATRVAITHKASRTRLKAVGSNPKTSLGLVGVPLAILDEPAALHTVGGTALWDAVRTAQGKPGSPLKAVVIGTLAPSDPGSWWPVLVENGTAGSTWVGLLQGRADRWSHWREVLRVNPLARHFPETAEVLREERDAAMADSRLAGAFKILPVEPAGGRRIHDAVERRGLGAGLVRAAGSRVATAGRWSGSISAPGAHGPPRSGCGAPAVLKLSRWRPASRAFEAQETARPGAVGEHIAGWRCAVRCAWPKDLRVATTRPNCGAPSRRRGESPARVVCDRFRLAELHRCDWTGRVAGYASESRWSEASEDIRALRKMTLRTVRSSVAPESRGSAHCFSLVGGDGRERRQRATCRMRKRGTQQSGDGTTLQLRPCSPLVRGCARRPYRGGGCARRSSGDVAARGSRRCRGGGGMRWCQ